MQSYWQSCEIDGHVNYSEACKRLEKEGIAPSDVQWAMTVRHPLSRLYSAVNHYLHCNPQRNLDEAIKEAVESPRALFQPQTWFWCPDKGIRLFAFESMSILDWLDWPEHRKRPHKNPGKPNASRDMIKNHKDFNTLLNRYDSDWALYEAASGSI